MKKTLLFVTAILCLNFINATTLIERKKTHVNHISQVMESLYWFNPIVSFEKAKSLHAQVLNNTCEHALPLQVNPSIECIHATQGQLTTQITQNLQPIPCYSESDVVTTELWYEFIATNTMHLIRFDNINQDFGVHLSLYDENICSTESEAKICSVVNGSSVFPARNLIVGNKYKIRIAKTNNYRITDFSICVLTPQTTYVESNTHEYTNEELVKKVLLKSQCITIENIKWKTGTNYNRRPRGKKNPNGIGYFKKNKSVFPFNDGLVLSTGDVLKASGPNTEEQAEGNTYWLDDPELRSILKNTLKEQKLSPFMYNATVLEFDFSAISNKISFNFIFASDEYGSLQCRYADAFAFILTDLQTQEKKNLAVVPDTTIPVSVVTVRDKKNNPDCDSQHEQYFDKYTNYGTDASALNFPINFKGYTKPLLAQSEVIPGRKYHIKLVIADGQDAKVDSAIFLQGQSFDIGGFDFDKKNVKLCPEEHYEIDTKLKKEFYDFQWFKDNQLLVGETNSKYTAEQAGIYIAKAKVKGSNCIFSDTINIEKSAPIFIKENTSFEICTYDKTISKIDLTSFAKEVLSETKEHNRLTINYFLSKEDAQNNINNIDNPSNYVPKKLPLDIYFRVQDKKFGCTAIGKFKLIESPKKEIFSIEKIITCKEYALPELTENYYYSTKNYGEGQLLFAGEKFYTGNHIIYVNAKNEKGCISSKKQEIQVNDCFIPKGISPNNDGLNDNLDLTHHQVLKIKIYNRYGKEVYTHLKGYLNQWHGQSNDGQKLPTGSYFYYITTTKETYSGSILLMR